MAYDDRDQQATDDNIIWHMMVEVPGSIPGGVTGDFGGVVLS